MTAQDIQPQVWDPSEPGILCDYTGSMKPALGRSVFLYVRQGGEAHLNPMTKEGLCKVICGQGLNPVETEAPVSALLCLPHSSDVNWLPLFP